PDASDVPRLVEERERSVGRPRRRPRSGEESLSIGRVEEDGGRRVYRRHRVGEDARPELRERGEGVLGTVDAVRDMERSVAERACGRLDAVLDLAREDAGLVEEVAVPLLLAREALALDGLIRERGEEDA